MVVVVLVVLAAVFLVLGFAHAITLLVGVALAVACLIAAVVIGGGLTGRWRV